MRLFKNTIESIVADFDKTLTRLNTLIEAESDKQDRLLANIIEAEYAIVEARSGIEDSQHIINRARRIHGKIEGLMQ